MKHLRYYLLFIIMGFIEAKANVYIIDGIYYQTKEDTHEAVVWRCQSDKYGATTVLPTVDGYPVVGIESAAFGSCQGITTVTLPNTCRYISDQAFNRCSSLESIEIPNTVTSIGFGAFRGCTHLYKVTIPESVTTIGQWVFYGCI